MLKRKTYLLSFFLLTSLFSSGQIDSIPQKEYSPYKFAAVSGFGSAFYGGMLVGLSTVWYQDNNRTDFHFTNDNYN